MKSVKNPEVGTLWIGLGMEGGGANGARQAWEGDTFQVAPMAWIGDLGISHEKSHSIVRLMGKIEILLLLALITLI